MLARTIRPFLLLMAFGPILFTRAVPAQTDDCNDRLSRFRNVIVRHFRSSKPVPPVPAWVNEARSIDPKWWRETLLASREVSIRELHFADGSTAKLDRYLGAGADGITYCFNGCSLVIKLPKLATLDTPHVILDEVHRSLELHRAGFTIAPVLGHSRPGDVPWVVKPFVDGESLYVVQGGTMTPAQIDGIAKIYATGVRSGVYVDLIGANYDNIIWDKNRREWVIVDLGKEGSPAYFAPFDMVFRAGTETTSTLLIYRSDVFNYDDAAAVRFKAKAQELLRARFEKR